MAIIGLDCNIILDNVGYFVKVGSYRVIQERIRQLKYRADGELSYIDHGPGKRLYNMVILAHNDLRCYDGSATGITGQEYRNNLYTSFINSSGNIITFTDPIGTNVNVHFEHYEETIFDLRSQILGLFSNGGFAASYEITVALQEA